MKDNFLDVDNITFHKIARPTFFTIKNGEKWLDVDICQPKDKAVCEFVVNTRTLKRLWGMFLKEDECNWVVDDEGTFYTEVLAWRKD